MKELDFNFCILCGKCLEVCPVFNVTKREEYSPRTKAFLLNHIEEFDKKKVKKVLSRCVGCYRCHEVCTQHIDLPEGISKIRNEIKELREYLYVKTASNLHNLSPLIKFFLKVKGLDYFFDDSLKFECIEIVNEPVKTEKQRAVVFEGCTARHFKKQWIDKAKRIGNVFYNVVDEEVHWDCCGYPFYFAGDREKTKECFETNIGIWQELEYPQVLVFCATCYFSLRKNALLIEDIDLRTKWLNSIVYLSDLLDHRKKSLIIKEKVDSLVLHKPCHMEEKSFKKLSVFFKSLKINVEEVLTCCGFGGCTRVENKELCDMLGKSLWENIGSRDLVISGCSGCILQMCFTGDNKKVHHWLDIFTLK